MSQADPSRTRRHVITAAQWRRYAVRHPVALGLAAVVLGASIATGSLWGADATAWGSGAAALADGRWWSVATALVVPDSTVEVLLSVLLALTAFAYAESLLGHLRSAVVFVCGGVLSILLGALAHTVLWGFDDLRPLESNDPVLDPSMGIFAAVLAASALSSALWRRRIRLVALATVVMFALYAGDADSWYRLIATLLGLGAGSLLARRAPRSDWHRSSSREVRALMAVLVAITGLGPLAAVIAGGGRGPFSVVASSFLAFDEHLVDRCEVSYRPVCDHEFALVLTRGVGPVLLALVPLALLIVAALGLRRGRHAGLVLAVCVQSVLAILALYAVLSGELAVEPWADGSGLEYVLWGVASIGVPVASASALIVVRRRFPVRATRQAARTFAATVLIAFFACGAVFVASETLLRQSFDVTPTLTDIVVESWRRFVPPAFLQGIGQPPFPRHGAALWIYQWVGVVFWAIVVLALVRLYRSVRRPEDADARLYRDLLRRGGGTLSFLGTWRGTSYWYSADRACAVAYRLVGDVALAVGDPLAPSGEHERAIRGFVDFCGESGWTAAFYSIHDDALPVFDDMGWKYLSVGEETVLAASEVTLEGKQWQKVRQPVTRAEREGMTAVWTRWADLSAAERSQIREIDEQWVADKALPEMGFTLGTLEEITDPEVALLLAVDDAGRIQVVTSWMPSWRGGVRSGWTLDFMRRRADGPNGLMEFAIARAAQQAAADGVAELSLSGAPMAVKPDVAASGDTTILSGVLGWLAQTLEPAYGFDSLFRFKRKFHPRYRTIWLAYGDAVDLPRIGTAIGRAYLPDATVRDVLTLLRSARGGDK